MTTTLLNKIRKLLVLSVMVLPAVVQAAPALITKVSSEFSNNHTRLILEVKNLQRFNVFTLPNPNRVIVDIDGGVLETNLKQLNLPRTLIKRVRSGWHTNGTFRIVFDMTVKTQVKNFIADAHNRSALVLELFPTQPIKIEEPVVITKKESPTIVPTFPIKEVKKNLAIPVVTKPLIKPPISTVMPSILPTKIERNNGSTNVSNQAKKPRPQAPVLKSHPVVVVIDAGHGGKDAGTVGANGTKEKDIVLRIASRLASLLSAEPNIQVVLTRKEDSFVPLSERLSIARRAKADLFVAIHADSYFNNKQEGSSVYALSHHGATSEAARWLADKENHSELGGVNLNSLDDNNQLRSVLIDLAQTATSTDSMTLGANIIESLKKTTKLHSTQVEQAPFMVLKSPDIPSVLVETGFLSNPQEEERLCEENYDNKLAAALLEGITSYISTHPMIAMSVKAETLEV